MSTNDVLNICLIIIIGFILAWGIYTIAYTKWKLINLKKRIEVLNEKKVIRTDTGCSQKDIGRTSEKSETD